MKKKSLMLLIFLILMLCSCKAQSPNSDEETNTNTSLVDCVVGLISNESNGSYAVLINTNVRSYTTLIELPDVTPDNYTALSPDGKLLAYTMWDSNFERRYLKIYSFETEETKSYFTDISAKTEIVDISWLPNSSTLLFIERNADIASYMEIKTIDIFADTISTLVKGEVWRVRDSYDNETPLEDFYLKGANKLLEPKCVEKDSRFEDENYAELYWAYYLSQEDIDEIFQTYGGNGSFDIDLIPNLMYVDFSSPRCSPDGKKILYSASLQRNSAPGAQTPLWIIASIFEYDMETGENKIIYTQMDGGNIGHVDWVDNSTATFISYYGFTGTADNVNLFYLDTSEVEVIFPYTEENYNNVTLLPLNSTEISFTSSAKNEYYEDSKTYVYSLSNNRVSQEDFLFNGETVLLQNFNYCKVELSK